MFSSIILTFDSCFDWLNFLGCKYTPWNEWWNGGGRLKVSPKSEVWSSCLLPKNNYFFIYTTNSYKYWKTMFLFVSCCWLLTTTDSTGGAVPCQGASASPGRKQVTQPGTDLRPGLVLWEVGGCSAVAPATASLAASSLHVIWGCICID